MLYPLRVTPIYRSAIWGGRRLAALPGRELPCCAQISESWDVSGHPKGMSIVENGPLAGISLHEIFTRYRTELLGRHAELPFERFPLLVKFLDANRQLSVQVHPDAEYVAREKCGDSEKAEAWVVLDADPGSRMSLGFQRPVTREEVADAVRNESLESILAERSPMPGECYFLPPGTVHSLGSGIFLYEIQQCSDLTFRLYDWNREDEHGNRRELHVAQALENLKPEYWSLAPVPRKPTGPGKEMLLDEEVLALDRLSFSEELPKHVLDCSDSCRILTVIAGSLMVEGLDRELVCGGSVILPASLGKVHLESRNALVLDAHLPIQKVRRSENE
ncbi:MAG: hypothetical protein E7029_12410 [Planctomycetaceae bacterium]|nr:hypothetical protein [Planctomycetaceae bacterium]